MAIEWVDECESLMHIESPWFVIGHEYNQKNVSCPHTIFIDICHIEISRTMVPLAVFLVLLERP